MDADDPRAVRSRERIVSAARELLRGEGPAAVTFAAVAQRAGVGRATVYRHWATVDALRDEIMDEFTLPFFERPGRPLPQWLHGQLRRLADELTTPAAARMTTSLIQRDAADDGALNSRRDRLFGVLEERLAAVLHQAGSTTTRPAEEVAASLIGPLLYLCLARGRRASDDFIRTLIAEHLPG
ncbi:TetR/AcrR family transcriptional regulator [Catenuloplanes atrovinosus]|uniref:AcrR family transcriptional regulator n=1 Tax=Catenuloplanes atrovinosus TaxID=137266 RepID=A0AAE3YRQ1_9ACTN|nr:TetR/AcrR family transcriptional regulator [Catenuloplanes atrovinosus]MDR7277233.1 AcrR family transcriptional regulator [Catenuloplanes atrovinosus]